MQSTGMTVDLAKKIEASIRTIPDYPTPGVMFRDITPIFSNPGLMDEITEAMLSQLKGSRIDAIAGIEARGFIFGAILANKLGCAFIPVRKLGKLPHQTESEEYTLEYGTATIEIHVDAVIKGSRVLIHDDLLATGGTAAAAARLIKRLGGMLAGFSFLVNLSFLPGEELLREQFGMDPGYLVRYNT